MPRMTPSRQRLLDFMVQHCREHGRPPSIREMCAAMRWRSTNAAQCALTALLDLGLLQHAPGTNRGWVPTSAVGVFLRSHSPKHTDTARVLLASWEHLDEAGLLAVRRAVENARTRMQIAECL